MATSNVISSSRRKLALIIGNNEYSSPGHALRNCINDANDLKEVLEKIKFKVTIERDLTNEKMVSAINSFFITIRNGDLVLFYFAGHGYQVRAENYLMPIDDTKIETEEDVESFGTPVEYHLNRFAKKNPSYVTIFILDCCRIYWPKNIEKTRGTVQGKGLHTINAPRGTFIQFACAADQTASDGIKNERNGLFTKHLLRHIIEPNEDISKIFRKIADGVYKDSKEKQNPLKIDGLMGDGHISLNEMVEDDSVPLPDQTRERPQVMPIFTAQVLNNSCDAGIAEVATVIQLITTCKEKVETVLSNKKACYVLADDLGVVYEILIDLKPDRMANSAQTNIQRVLNKLRNITKRASVLFDKCRSGKMTVRIRNFLSSTTIKDELQKLQSEIQIVIAMLSLVFQEKQNSPLTRSDIKVPPIDESMADQIDVKNIETVENDYLDGDD